MVMDSFFVRLKPEELEERFRGETLARDKTQIVVVLVVTLGLLVGFIALDLQLYNNYDLRITIVSRSITAVASLAAIWMIKRKSDTRSIDRITFMWMLVNICHLLIVNAVRPTDYIPVVVWDLLTIYGIYFFVTIPFHFLLLSAFLLTGGSIAVWLAVRIPFAGTYDTLAILTAYLVSNGYGIYISKRMNQSRRQQFVLLLQEKRSRKDLSERTIELEKTQEELEELAMTDPLTGIYNRRYFMSKVSEELARTKRYGHPLSLMVLDVDHLKDINDTYGHEVGDEVLKSFAKHCLLNLRSTDHLARMGGDEFIALLIQTDQDEAQVIAERFRESIAEMELEFNNIAIQTSVSIGLITSRDGELSVEELLKGADEALYKAKERGRNQIVSR
jgi:diguanylate cyclase (GGDEF)-like protein